MSVLGIDVGTTGCKAASFSAQGRRIAIAYREYGKISLPAGHAELDSAAVFDDICACIAQVAAQTTHDTITALSVSSLGEAMTPVTENHRIIGSSILCADVRGGDYARQLAEAIGPEAFYAINPNILGANYSLPKLMWIREHDRQLYDRADKFLLWADLVIYMLGGAAMTSYSLANRTLLFDIRQCDWSATLLGLDGVDIDRRKLPDVVPSGTSAGVIDKATADKLNLPADVQLIVGGHDQCCNALGAGAVEQGKTICGMGTFECITPVYDRMPDQTACFLENGLNIEHHVLPDHYVSFLYNQSGSLVKWFRDTFAAADRKLLKDGQDIYDVLIAEMPADVTSLFVLPHFEMTGPPKFITDSSGVILGLTTSTTRGEILKAVLECATLYFVDSLERLKTLGIETSQFIATGGGAKSDAWLQLKADILGIPFIRLKQTECSLVGAAVIAGLACGLWDSPTEAAALFAQPAAVFEPNAQTHARYQEKHQLYSELYPSLKHYLSTCRRFKP